MARNLDPASRDAKLEAIRRQNAADARRARTISIVAAAIVVVLVTVVVVVIVLSGRDRVDAAEVVYPQETTLTTEGEQASGGFLLGEQGPVELVVYEDFQCPACKSFEAQAGPYISELEAGTDVSVVRRPIAILDRFTGEGVYSTRSAAAAACVGSTGDDEAYTAFSELLFAEQPDESAAGNGLSDDRLAELAAQAGADTGEVADCIADGTYVGWAGAATEAASTELDQLSTPAITLDGELVTATDSSNPPSLAELQAAVDAAVAGQG